jgi:large subunit ribosomal protein L16
MLYVPSKQKYKKHQKGKSFNKVKIPIKPLKYGQLGLKALTTSRINSKQIITLYNNIKKKIKKKGKVIINIFPQITVTKKPVEVRMGKGKGSVNFWVARVSPGSTICEISTYNINLAIKVLNRVRFKIPIKTKIIYRTLF